MVSEGNAELLLMRVSSSRPVSNCPVVLLLDPNQPLLVLQKNSGEALAVVWGYRSPFPLFRDRFLIGRRHTISIPLLGHFPQF